MSNLLLKLGFTKTGVITFAPVNRSSWTNVLNIMKVSKGIYPATLFGHESSWQFKPWKSCSHMDNKQLLKHLIAIVEKQNQ